MIEFIKVRDEEGVVAGAGGSKEKKDEKEVLNQQEFKDSKLNISEKRRDEEATLKQRAEKDELTIRQLVERIRQGEIELFEIIIERYHGEVFSVAWQISRNYDDACDIVQEAFLRMYRALISWRGKAKFSTWAYRVTLNTALDYLRREARHYRQRLYNEVENPGSKVQSPIIEGEVYRSPKEVAQQHYDAERVKELLLRLSPMQRKCFLLHYFQELTIKEISQIVRCSVGAVKRHLFRAKAKIKKLLEEK